MRSISIRNIPAGIWFRAVLFIVFASLAEGWLRWLSIGCVLAGVGAAVVNGLRKPDGPPSILGAQGLE